MEIFELDVVRVVAIVEKDIHLPEVAKQSGKELRRRT